VKLKLRNVTACWRQSDHNMTSSRQQLAYIDVMSQWQWTTCYGQFVAVTSNQLMTKLFGAWRGQVQTTAGGQS